MADERARGRGGFPEKVKGQKASGVGGVCVAGVGLYLIKVHTEIGADR